MTAGNTAINAITTAFKQEPITGLTSIDGICFFTITKLTLTTIIKIKSDTTYAYIALFTKFLNKKYITGIDNRYIDPDIKLTRFILPVDAMATHKTLLIRFNIEIPNMTRQNAGA